MTIMEKIVRTRIFFIPFVLGDYLKNNTLKVWHSITYRLVSFVHIMACTNDYRETSERDFRLKFCEIQIGVGHQFSDRIKTQLE